MGQGSGAVGEHGDVHGLLVSVYDQDVLPGYELNVEVALSIAADRVAVFVEKVEVLTVQLEDVRRLQVLCSDGVVDGLDLDACPERFAVRVEQVDPQREDALLVGGELEVLFGVLDQATTRWFGNGVDLGAGGLGATTAGKGHRQGGDDQDGQGLELAVHGAPFLGSPLKRKCKLISNWYIIAKNLCFVKS